MQLGRAILGAIIGAAVGIAVLVGVYFALRIDSVWLALVVAVLTGLGVRLMVATSGHASYLRGALTGALALGAYLLGSYVVAGLAQQTAAKAAQATRIEQPAKSEQAKTGDTDDTDEATDEEVTIDPVMEMPEPGSKGAAGAARPQAATPRNFSTLDFILLCVSALIAYELGRGTAAKPVVVAEETTTEVPGGTHPDA